MERTAVACTIPYFLCEREAEDLLQSCEDPGLSNATVQPLSASPPLPFRSTCPGPSWMQAANTANKSKGWPSIPFQFQQKIIIIKKMQKWILLDSSPSSPCFAWNRSPCPPDPQGTHRHQTKCHSWGLAPRFAVWFCFPHSLERSKLGRLLLFEKPDRDSAGSRKPGCTEGFYLLWRPRSMQPMRSVVVAAKPKPGHCKPPTLHCILLAKAPSLVLPPPPALPVLHPRVSPGSGAAVLPPPGSGPAELIQLSAQKSWFILLRYGKTSRLDFPQNWFFWWQRRWIRLSQDSASDSRKWSKILRATEGRL